MLLNIAEAIGHLRTAHTILETDKESYICHALRMAVDSPLSRTLTGNDTVDALLKYIRTELAKWREPFVGEGVLTSSVAANMLLVGHDELAKRVSGECYGRLMRLAWIDRMIHELETEGKLP